jgi:hypothetical protein
MTMQQVGRLALRVEGNFWVAYFAELGTMVGAVEMGRVAMTIVRDPQRKAEFIELFKGFLAEFLKEKTGSRSEPEWTTRAAPESERSGRA